MQKIANQIADKVWQKLAEDGARELPGYMALRPKSMMEDTGMSFFTGALPGAAMGTFGAALHPGMAKAIPSDKLRMIAGLLGGAGVGGSISAGVTALANKVLDTVSRAEEQKLLERGQLTPEEAETHRTAWRNQ